MQRKLPKEPVLLWAKGRVDGNIRLAGSEPVSGITLPTFKKNIYYISIQFILVGQEQKRGLNISPSVFGCSGIFSSLTFFSFTLPFSFCFQLRVQPKGWTIWNQRQNTSSVFSWVGKGRVGKAILDLRRASQQLRWVSHHPFSEKAYFRWLSLWSAPWCALSFVEKQHLDVKNTQNVLK